MPAEFRFRAAVWRWDGPAGWHFVSLPEDIADEIEERCGSTAGGFGSVPVQVTIGATTWRTSLFPDNKRATYLLPVKQAVRRAEGLSDGTVADVTLAVVGLALPAAKRPGTGTGPQSASSNGA